ncbi:type II toxin-antitoxin system VapC family toxin [Amycolatopsis sp. VS8301801F10]|uniref:type II toxin-antitoxin system VapC family toxin n=1 Tax=Amycolatopsis sp. VS8301801F10 TaxID=2652442 RepID=UPI0038FD2B4F
MARPDSYTLAYLDSCVFTRYYTRGEGSHFIQQIMDAADARQFEICTSTFTLVECLGQSPTPRPDVGMEARVQKHLDSPRVTLVEFSREVALQARELHLTKQYRSGDAIHLASAVEAGADVLFTLDNDDFQIGQRVNGVWIDNPYLPGDPNLFDQTGTD